MFDNRSRSESLTPPVSSPKTPPKEITRRQFLNELGTAILSVFVAKNVPTFARGAISTNPDQKDSSLHSSTERQISGENLIGRLVRWSAQYPIIGLSYSEDAVDFAPGSYNDEFRILFASPNNQVLFITPVEGQGQDPYDFPQTVLETCMAGAMHTINLFRLLDLNCEGFPLELAGTGQVVLDTELQKPPLIVILHPLYGNFIPYHTTVGCNDYRSPTPSHFDRIGPRLEGRDIIRNLELSYIDFPIPAEIPLDREDISNTGSIMAHEVMHSLQNLNFGFQKWLDIEGFATFVQSKFHRYQRRDPLSEGVAFFQSYRLHKGFSPLGDQYGSILIWNAIYNRLPTQEDRLLKTAEMYVRIQRRILEVMDEVLPAARDREILMNKLSANDALIQNQGLEVLYQIEAQMHERISATYQSIITEKLGSQGYASVVTGAVYDSLKLQYATQYPNLAPMNINSQESILSSENGFSWDAETRTLQIEPNFRERNRTFTLPLSDTIYCLELPVELVQSLGVTVLPPQGGEIEALLLTDHDPQHIIPTAASGELEIDATNIATAQKVFVLVQQ